MATKLTHNWLTVFVACNSRGKTAWKVVLCKPWDGTKYQARFLTGKLVLSTSMRARVGSYRRKPHYYL